MTFIKKILISYSFPYLSCTMIIHNRSKLLIWKESLEKKLNFAKKILDLHFYFGEKTVWFFSIYLCSNLVRYCRYSQWFAFEVTLWFLVFLLSSHFLEIPSTIYFVVLHKEFLFIFIFKGFSIIVIHTRYGVHVLTHLLLLFSFFYVLSMRQWFPHQFFIYSLHIIMYSEILFFTFCYSVVLFLLLQ